jgi:hypothetical protein
MRAAIISRPMITLRNGYCAAVRTNRLLFATILLLGLYSPTSWNENISKRLYLATFLVTAVVLATLALRTGCEGRIVFWVSIPMVLWLTVCTFLSMILNHFDMQPVQLALFALLGFMLCINAGRLKCGNLSSLLAFASIVNISVGVAMVAAEQVSTFMLVHYSNFYDELLPRMISEYKPVTTFATHSVAGFFAYIFFFLNFRTYQKSGNRLHLFLAILYVGMCIAMMSTTSLGLSVLAIAELVYIGRWKVLLFAPVLYFLMGDLKEDLSVAMTALWQGEGNGFGARYGAGGILQESVAYIVRHPLLPVGVTFSSGFSFIDSGPIEYILCGSLPLLLLVYGGLFLFLRRNLFDPWDVYRLFAVILVAELGFTLLTYMRSFLLIPAFVIYLNSLPNRISDPSPGTRAALLGKTRAEVAL